MTRVILLKVEDCIGTPNRFERELGNELVLAQQFSTFGWRPAEQCQEVAKRSGNEPAIPIRRQRDDFAVLSFRELALVGGQNQRQMREPRDGSSERLVKQ